MDHKQPSRMNDEQIAEIFKILKDANSVELKLTVPDSDRYSAITALDMDVLEAELRQVVFFDTPDLKLSHGGVVVRARRIRNGGDTVVKLRPVAPADLPARIRRSKRFKIELDASPASFVCSGSLRGKIDNTSVKEVLQGKRPIRKLYSQEQRDFYLKH